MNRIGLIALGSNLLDPQWRILLALRQLKYLNDFRLEVVSSFYQSPPIDGAVQPDYINAVVGFSSSLEPCELLWRLKCLEVKMGRQKVEHEKKTQSRQTYEPRVIDLDLIWYDAQKISNQAILPTHHAPLSRQTHLPPSRLSIQLPHPRFYQRLFVLKPCLELRNHSSFITFSNKNKAINHFLDDCHHYNQALSKPFNPINQPIQDPALAFQQSIQKTLHFEKVQSLLNQSSPLEFAIIKSTPSSASMVEKLRVQGVEVFDFYDDLNESFEQNRCFHLWQNQGLNWMQDAAWQLKQIEKIYLFNANDKKDKKVLAQALQWFEKRQIKVLEV